MNYQWGVIGAGPAGIAAVGKLLDFGVAARDIVWMDPAFKVGDFGTIWRNVPSNTKVNLFLSFLHAARAFDYQDHPGDFALDHVDLEDTCNLSVISEPLQWVTLHLKKKVKSIQEKVVALELKNNVWDVCFNHHTSLKVKNIILAIGSEPKDLHFPNITSIPLQDALDNKKIRKQLHPQDTIAVFGSSHSAILVLRNLVENNIKQIVNFYRSPLRYAVYLEDWILFDDSGLKGVAARWARAHLDGTLPCNLLRIYANENDVEHYLPQCNKAIYAIGFERRLLPVIKNIGHMDYIAQCGIIAPGLFGLGIAFPEAKLNPLGILEYRVGLGKFMDYLHKVLPLWMKYPA